VHNLEETYQRCLRMCDDCGIAYGTITAVKPSSRAIKQYGNCRKNGDGTFTIRINKLLLDDEASIDALEETLLHEICHTIPDGFRHTGAWKQAAKQLNLQYGYRIARLSTPEEKGIDGLVEERDQHAKYHVRCTKCGNVLHRQTRSAVVKHPWRYRCGKCGGRLKLE